MTTTMWCFECLQRRIESDFSGKLSFIYGVSDSHLPFASQAVVQASNSQQQYLLSYLPYHPLDDCLAKYVDEYCAVQCCDGSGRDDFQLSPVSTIEQSGGRNSTLLGQGCETCAISSQFSCSRVITSMAPIAQIGNASSEIFEDLDSSFTSGSIEDNILRSLTLFIEGKSTVRESINFLSLVGLPSFEEKGFPGCIRHPNIAPILGLLRSSSEIQMVLPKMTYTLENMLHYSPGALKSDWHARLLIYQILSALAYMHGLGIAHGNLRPSNVMLTDTSWCWLQISKKQLLNPKVISTGECHNCCSEGCSTGSIYADLNLSSYMSWQSSFYSWWNGELSNFEYLLILNRLAGRRWGDHTFYTVMPWVTDFTVKPDADNNTGWRDLTMSKWRLAKGDEQLDFTYSTSEIAHHVSDECLSELAVCSYKARRLPLSVLRVAVRSVYEPNEYPANMQRLYQWTPDECIPEFYCDPRIFYSLHSGMADLAVPSWAGTPEEFI